MAPCYLHGARRHYALGVDTHREAQGEAGGGGTVGAQVDAARAAVLVVRATDRSALEAVGPDARTWLNGLVTCDIASLPEGRAAYGLAVTQKGRILADLWAIVDGPRVVVVVPASQASALAATFDKYLIMEDVELREVDSAIWHLHGPRSSDVLAAARAAGAASADADVTGLGGAIVVAPRDREAAVDAAIGAAVLRAGGARGDDASWDTLRLEHAVPRFGADFDLLTYPHEAALEKRAVSFEKGCYLGQEVVCMLEMRGHVKRKLAPIVVRAGEPPAKGAEVFDGAGAKVGEVTSAAWSARAGASVALAMVKLAAATPGTALTVGGAPAEVVTAAT